MLQLKFEPVEESQIDLRLNCKSTQRLNLSLNHQPVIGMQLGVKLDSKLVLSLAPFYRGGARPSRWQLNRRSRQWANRRSSSSRFDQCGSRLRNQPEPATWHERPRDY